MIVLRYNIVTSKIGAPVPFDRPPLALALYLWSEYDSSQVAFCTSDTNRYDENCSAAQVFTMPRWWM